MMTMGPNALVVVGLIAFLVGTTIAIQSAAQLRQLGANILIVDLIGVSITRELGPLITAIVTTGRTGSAIAAEIATMVITEEIDALIALGIQPLRFIVLPKILALMTILPILSIYANVMAILGGVWVAQWLLDVPVTTFINRLQVVVLTDDIISGLFKSLLFAILIGTVSAFCGLRTQGGADAVGFSTTKSVVVGLFSIIIGDAICSFLFHGMK
jgi:phospholipid/cholesterol/gamma-HCH transport system permease protein